MLRRLSTLASFISLVLCAGMCVLWVRSYRFGIPLCGCRGDARQNFFLVSPSNPSPSAHRS